MYLSRVILDTTNRKVIEGLARPSIFHGAIEWSVGEERTRNIWRIDQFQGRESIIILTPVIPDLTDFCKQFGLPSEKPLTKSYDHFLESLCIGQTWRFRAKVNPVRIHENKRCPVMNKDLREWFFEKAQRLGMEIDNNSLNIVEIREYNFYKDISMRGKRGSYVRFKAVTYEGIMKIIDEEQVRKALVNGIGKEKAYGCGMLTLARV